MSNFLPDDKFDDILNCFIADCGIRETAIIVGVSKNTVKKIWREFWSHNYRRHCRMVWNKTNGIAPAFSVRFSHEYLIWFYKPKFTPVHSSCRGKFTTVFTEKPREHSRKPNIAYNMIKEMFPDTTRLDVFSREDRPSWDTWGDECGKFNQP